MKKIMSFLCVLALSMALFGCQSNEPYQQIDITYEELKQKIDDKESFIFIVERENCPYCEALQTYIDETKDEHPNLTLYVLDCTDYELSKESDDATTLISSTEAGQYLLELAPYFLYTPSIYVVEDGTLTHSGIGYSESENTISLWDVDSTIDFDLADTQSFWEFLEVYE